MSSLMELSVREYNDKLASGEATPGGGSASALAGANAAALIGMFCRLTTGRKKFESVHDKMHEILVHVDGARERLLELANWDAKAYSLVVEAYSLPKNTPEEELVRKEAVEDAVKGAARVPLEVCAWAEKLLSMSQLIYKDGNPNGLTDLGVAIQLVLASFSGAALNVYINCDTLSDETFIVSSKKTVHDLETSVRMKSMELGGAIFSMLNVD